MTFRSLLLVPFLFASFCVTPAVCEEGLEALVTGSGVNLRSGPGRSYEILLQMARGSKLRVLERRKDWIAVALPETVPAYLHRSTVGEPKQGWAAVKGERVQVRVRPADSSTSWGEISSPERVRVLGTHGDWVQVQPPSFCRGWVSAEYVTFLQKEEANPPRGTAP